MLAVEMATLTLCTRCQASGSRDRPGRSRVAADSGSVPDRLREGRLPGGIEGGGSSDALRPAKARQHGAFVRRHRKEAHHQGAKQDVPR